MSESKNRLLILFGGCTAFLWRYAWINFITVSVLDRAFPFLWAVVFFWSSFFITFVTSGRGRRVIVLVLSHLLGFSLATFGTLHCLYDIQTGVLHPWIGAFFSRPRELIEWLMLFLFMGMPLLFWAGGVLLAKRKAQYTGQCARLDIGITFFFLLFLMKFLVRFQDGIIISDEISIRLFYPFLIFGLAGVALSKNKGSVDKEFLLHHKGTGIVLTFTTVLLVFITGFSLLFMPLMNTAAEAGYGIFTIVAKPLGGFFVRILRFLFLGSRARSSTGSSGGVEDNTVIPLSEADAAGGLFERIVHFLLIGILIAIGIGLVVVVLWFLVRKLLSRTESTKGKEQRLGLSELLNLLKARLNRFFTAVSSFFRRLLRRYSGIGEIYLSFLRWGRRGGMERRKNETPEEYRLRLLSVYPFVEKEITNVTRSFIQDYYGPPKSRDSNPDNAVKSLRRLKSVRYFFPRMKVWLNR